jgi:hypothetical protein
MREDHKMMWFRACIPAAVWLHFMGPLRRSGVPSREFFTKQAFHEIDQHLGASPMQTGPDPVNRHGAWTTAP